VSAASGLSPAPLLCERGRGAFPVPPALAFPQKHLLLGAGWVRDVRGLVAL